MPVHPNEAIEWFEGRLTELLAEAYAKGVPDAGIVTVLKVLLQAHIESARAVLLVLEDYMEEDEETGGPDYIG
jgi:hypothetical protein